MARFSSGTLGSECALLLTELQLVDDLTRTAKRVARPIPTSLNRRRPVSPLPRRHRPSFPCACLGITSSLGCVSCGGGDPPGRGWFMGRWFRSARIVTFLCVQVQAVVMPACKRGTDGQPFPPIALDPVQNHVGVVAPSARWPERRVHRWACLIVLVASGHGAGLHVLAQ